MLLANFSFAEEHHGQNDLDTAERTFHLPDCHPCGADTGYKSLNLVSDGSVPAAHTDPNLVNSWGVVFQSHRIRLGERQRHRAVDLVRRSRAWRSR